MSDEAPPAFFTLSECPIDGCPNQHESNRLMCRPCWYSVPRELRDEVETAWRQEGRRSERYRTACAAAVAAVP